jgi:hypothetical protein
MLWVSDVLPGNVPDLAAARRSPGRAAAVLDAVPVLAVRVMKARVTGSVGEEAAGVKSWT